MQAFLGALDQFLQGSRSLQDYQVLQERFETLLYNPSSKKEAKKNAFLRRKIAVASLALSAAWPFVKDEGIVIFARTLVRAGTDDSLPEDPELAQIRQLFCDKVNRFPPILANMQKAA